MAESRLVRIVVKAVDQVTGPVRRMNRALGGLGSIAAAVGAVQLGRVLTRNLINVGRTAISIGSAFDQSMANVAAITKAAGSELQALEKTARDLGKSTVFSAVEAGEAMESFALAGFENKEIIGALKPTLDLAAAGNIGMAEAASIAAGTMRAMNLQVKDLPRVMDTLANAATTSNQTISDLGENLKLSAPLANSLGVSLEELAAASALLANRNIKASIAGTSLRRTFAVLLGDIEEGETGFKGLNLQLRDSKGKFLGLRNAFNEFSKAGIGSAEILKRFGLRAGPAVQILLELGDPALKKATEEMFRVGTAAEIAARKIDTFKGDVKILKSALSESAIILFRSFEPALRAATQGVTALVTEINDATGGLTGYRDQVVIVSNATLDLAETSIVLSSAIAKLSVFMVKNAEATATGTGPLQALVVGFTAFQPIISKVTGELQKDAEALREEDSVFGTLLRSIAVMRETLGRYKVEVVDTTSKTDGLTQSMLDLEKQAAGPLTQLDTLFKKLGITLDTELLQKADDVTLAFQLLAQELTSDGISEERFKFLSDTLTKMAATIRDEGGIIFSMQQLEVAGLQTILTLSQAVSAMNRDWAELVNLIKLGELGIISLGKQITKNVGQVATNAALTFGDTLVDAAFGAEVAWDQFFKNLLKQILKAILQAAILRAILSGATGGAGAALPLGSVGGGGTVFMGKGGIAGRGRGLVGARQGLIAGIAGVDLGRDVFPAILRPKEAVLPPALTEFLVSAALGGGAESQSIDVNIRTDVPSFIERTNRDVQTGLSDLRATRIASRRQTR